MAHAVGMLKLDRTHTMLWRSTTTVQFGADQPIVILPDMTSATERIIAVLSAGVSDVSLTAIAAQLGLTPAELKELLARLEPVLVPNPIDRSWRITIDGSGLTADWLSEMLEKAGHHVVSTTPDLGIIIGHHVLLPDQAGSWLRRDIPHLPVIFGDTHVRIGPFVTPDDGPCLHCMYLQLAIDDPCWPLLASQLLVRASDLETMQVCVEVSTMITRWINNAGGPQSLTGLRDRHHPTEGLARGEVVELDAVTGRLTRVIYRRQEACACQALPQNVTQLESHRDGIQARTTIMKADVGRV